MKFVADISIPLNFNGPQPNAFGVDAATSKTLGDTRDGSSVNFEQYTLTPHCNGTHTECVGHITDERISVRECLRDVVMNAVLVTAEPRPVANGDLVITRDSLLEILADTNVLAPAAFVLRTLPNDDTKLTQRYDGNNLSPYFDVQAMEFILEFGFTHLLVDLPSIDRLDDPDLPAHRVFWNVEQGRREVNAATRINSTITEMIYVPNEVADGEYLLNLQIAPFASDAVPSRPILLLP